jgi:tetratricopeptide (TPR) repeat protein
MTNSPESHRPEPNVPPRTFWSALAVCLLLALGVWIVFGQTIHYGFINYDDDLYIYENPMVTRGLDIFEIPHVFAHDTGPDEWYPLAEISHMLDWQLYGPDAGGHHLTNVILHAATAILLFLALRKMTGTLWTSAFVAVVFAVHPLRVESVAWVMERKDVLSGFFFMLALWTWARYAQNRTGTASRETNLAPVLSSFGPGHWTPDYYLALVFFALAFVSKAVVVTFPFVLLLLDYWPLKRTASGPGLYIWLGLVLEKMPFFLLSAAGCVATILSQPDVAAVAQGQPIFWRIENAAMAYVDYIGHMIYPAGLALLYAHPEKNLPVGKVIASAAILLGITVCVIASRRKRPYLVTGWFWYLGMFVPMIDMMQAGDQTRGDRYTYLPQIGLFIIVAWGTAEFCRTFRLPRIVPATAAALILIALLSAAYVQTKYWKDSITLWTRTLACTPESYIAHCNLGIALADEGKSSEAIEHFQDALQINPDDAKSLNNLGKVFMTEGRLDEAMGYFNHALQLKPDDVKVLNNIGVMLTDEGKLDEATRELNRVLKLDPDFTDACYNLGNVLILRGYLDEAVESYRQALEINPDLPDVQCNLGVALARQGNMDEAIAHYQQAIQLKPQYADALNDLAGALTAQGKFEEAAKYYEEAIQAKPNDPNALNNLGVALARLGKPDEAVQRFNQALRFNPDDASTYNNLGITLAKEGKLDEATRDLQQALDLARRQNNIALENSIAARLNTLGQRQQ